MATWLSQISAHASSRSVQDRCDVSEFDKRGIDRESSPNAKSFAVRHRAQDSISAGLVATLGPRMGHAAPPTHVDSTNLYLPQPSDPVFGPISDALTDLGQPAASLASAGLPSSTVMIAVFGIGFLIAEGTALSMQGMRGVGIAVITILVASTVSSIVGFAFSALCGALLFHLMDSPIYAVQVMIICSIAIQLLSVATLWRSIDWLSLPIFLAGGVLGVPAGVYMLLHLPTSAYRDVIGVLLIAYGTYLLLRWPTRSLRVGPSWDAGVGFLGGVTGGLAGFPGAFVTIWCGLKGWDKTRQRGVYQPFILCMQPISLVFIYLMRPASLSATQLDVKTLAFIPAALLGAWLGLRIFKRLSDRQFEIAVNALIVVSGIGLIL
jgi:uncharacterized membrane protein YfcA